MAWFGKDIEPKTEGEASAQKPQLDLSGPVLRLAMQRLAEAAEETGGIERYLQALACKVEFFKETLAKGNVESLTVEQFYDLCTFITPARRKVGAWVEENGFEVMRDRLSLLLQDWTDVTTADARLAAFCQAFPQDRKHRWTQDLAAEVLHYTAPDYYPLMARWVWDVKSGTGVLREIWFADDVDAVHIPFGNHYAVYQTLREELVDFVLSNGVFEHAGFYVDVLCAYLYGQYIDEKGSAFYKGDFGHESDGMALTRRMLGLDGVNLRTGRSRLKLIEGEARVLDDPRLLH